MLLQQSGKSGSSSDFNQNEVSNSRGVVVTRFDVLLERTRGNIKARVLKRKRNFVKENGI